MNILNFVQMMEVLIMPSLCSGSRLKNTIFEESGDANGWGGTELAWKTMVVEVVIYAKMVAESAELVVAEDWWCSGDKQAGMKLPISFSHMHIIPQLVYLQQITWVSISVDAALLKLDTLRDFWIEALMFSNKSASRLSSVKLSLMSILNQ